MNGKCPVCDSELAAAPESAGRGDATRLHGPQCGSFILSDTLLATLPRLRTEQSGASAKLSHALRRAQERSGVVAFSTSTVDAILAQPLPRPSQQADLLVRWLAGHLSGPGETTWLEPRTHSAIIGAGSPKGFALVLSPPSPQAGGAPRLPHGEGVRRQRRLIAEGLASRGHPSARIEKVIGGNRVRRPRDVWMA